MRNDEFLLSWKYFSVYEQNCIISGYSNDMNNYWRASMAKSNFIKFGQRSWEEAVLETSQWI